ncbi:dihydrolipoyl dehydrogenase family protein [Benzoatithermus flavus]|uniref:NAD(P)/FAD-dependent oxidoreductase n=1 Tax=Benzoatithermus flavus TaxID=3108223 RepID=A0ABU8XL03_9PROT
MTKSYDLVVIGTGTAAGVVANRCRKAGWSVAVIDNRPYGGTCALRGCDPKKMLRRGPEIVDAARRMEGRGIAPDGLHIDWAALQTHKRGFTDPVPAKRERGFAEQGIATFHGTARFLDQTTIAVGDDRLQGRRIVIATGMKPRPLGIPGEALVTTSDQFLELEHLPRRVLFIGGGYISFEFAHMAARTDAGVTVLTRGPRPLTAFDPDLAGLLVERSRAIGIDLHTRATVEAVERDEAGLRVWASVGGTRRAFEAELVVHGAGRIPAIDELDLAAGEVRAGKRGVEVNEHLQSTSNPAVYAAGDAAATAGPPLTPVSSLEGKVVAANLLQGNHATPDYTGVPSAVFTIPALARVGLLEEEAKAQGLDVEVKFTDMRGWYTVQRVGETHAAAKVLVEKNTGRIVGAHLLGPESVEAINLFALAMRNGLGADALKNFVSAYPSAGSDLGYLV